MEALAEFNEDLHPRGPDGKWIEGDPVGASDILSPSGEKVFFPDGSTNGMALTEDYSLSESAVPLYGDLTPAERESLDVYIGEGPMINQELRGGVAENFPTVKDLDRLFDREDFRLREDITVYRGINSISGGTDLVEATPIPEFKQGDVYQDRGFISTSSSPGVAKNFQEGDAWEQSGGGALLAIRVPEGTPALVVPVIAEGMGVLGEREVILDRNTQIVIDEVKTYEDDSGPRTTVTARVIPQEGGP